MTLRAILAGILFLALPATSRAAALEAKTLDAWNHYIRQARARMVERSHSPGRFLWIDEAPGRRSQVRAGHILVAPVAGNPTRIPYGLIHHWKGAVFLPNATLQDTLAVIRDYGRYSEFYQPLIVNSQPLGWTGSEYKFSLVMVNSTLFSKTAYRSECEDTYVPVDAARWYSIGYSDRIQEIEDYGGGAQRVLPPGEGSGYIWRLYSISRLEERDGGVYLEREVIVLSRDLPFAMRWLLEPIVNRLSRSSLSTSLGQTRDAVLAGPPSRIATN